MISLKLLHLCFFINIIFFYNIYARENVKKSVEDNREDEIGDDTKDDSMDIPSENESINNTTCMRRKNNLIHEIQAVTHGQYPFIVAIMSTRDEYICTGTFVANGIIVTSAQCTEGANYVLVNTTTAKKEDSSVILHITRSDKYPTYPASNKDVALAYTERLNKTMASKINIINVTKSSGVFELEAIGYGLNAPTGQPKELQSVGLEAEQTGEVTSAYLNCIATKVPSCFRDKGGPVISGTDLIGIIVKGEDECVNQMSSVYATYKHMVDFLNAYTFKTWLEQKVTENLDKSEVILDTYPKKPSRRLNPKELTASSGNGLLRKTAFPLLMQYFLLSFF